jgi:hypothetical protein
MASTLRALRDGWLPAGDQAIIATRAHDVFTSHTPLLGQHSDAGALTHHSLYSLGPMLYWLLALPVRLASPGALTLTIGLLNTAAIVGAVVLARRRGGRALMFVAALAIVLMSRSLPPEALHDVWNASAGLFPFTLLLFLCWSLACGEYRLLPLTVLVASFVVQCQFAFLGPSLGALAVGLAGLVVSLRSPGGDSAASRPDSRGHDDRGHGSRGRNDRRHDSPGRDDRGHVGRWALAALLVAAVCWTTPAIQQLEESPGNLTAIARTVTANHSTLGATVGWHAVVLTVGIVPWWLTNSASPWSKKNEVRQTPSALAIASAALLLCGLLILAGAGLLRRRVELWAGALIAVALCVGVAAIASATPTTRLLSATLGYTLWLASPAGMFAWAVLAWAPIALLLERGTLLERGLPRWLTPALASAAALGGVAIAATAVVAAQRPDEHLREYRPLGALFASLDRSIPAGRTVRLIGSLDNETFRFKMAARYALVRRGIRPLSPGTDTRLGSWYELRRRRYDCTVYVEDGHARPSRGAVPIAGILYDRSHPLSVWVAPAGCPARAGRSAVGAKTTGPGRSAAAAPPNAAQNMRSHA